MFRHYWDEHRLYSLLFSNSPPHQTHQWGQEEDWRPEADLWCCLWSRWLSSKSEDCYCLRLWGRIWPEYVRLCTNQSRHCWIRFEDVVSRSFHRTYLLCFSHKRRPLAFFSTSMLCLFLQANLLSSHRSLVHRVETIALGDQPCDRGENVTLFLFNDCLEVRTHTNPSKCFTILQRTQSHLCTWFTVV